MRIGCFLFVLPLFAHFVGNPGDPAIMNAGVFSGGYPFCKWSSGYLYDYIPNKRFVTKKAFFKRFGLQSQEALFSLIFVERLQFYASMGGSKEMLEEKSMYDFLFETKTGYHFSWSLGARVILFQWGQTFLSGSFTYASVPESSQSFLSILDRVNFPFPNADEKQKFSLEQWQASIGLASKLLFVTPYAGIDYFSSKLEVEKSYKEAEPIGYFYGFTLSVTGKFHLCFERRIGNEFGYSFATSAVF